MLLVTTMCCSDLVVGSMIAPPAAEIVNFLYANRKGLCDAAGTKIAVLSYAEMLEWIAAEILHLRVAFSIHPCFLCASWRSAMKLASP